MSPNGPLSRNEPYRAANNDREVAANHHSTKLNWTTNRSVLSALDMFGMTQLRRGARSHMGAHTPWSFNQSDASCCA